MNESTIIAPNLLDSLFRKPQDWPLINTSIWPPDITNLPSVSVPLCAFMDSVLFTVPLALSLEWNSSSSFSCCFIHFTFSFFCGSAQADACFLVISASAMQSYPSLTWSFYNCCLSGCLNCRLFPALACFPWYFKAMFVRGRCPHCSDG